MTMGQNLVLCILESLKDSAYFYDYFCSLIFLVTGLKKKSIVMCSLFLKTHLLEVVGMAKPIVIKPL